ncbi:MAG: hypothetical protein P1V20_27465 [Verrucomicrobiales bacterium]|nr:hypothetical protein [Verrucomicrobiales bacterium]
MKHFSRLCLLLLFSALYLQSCDKIDSVLNPNWLIGTWEIDQQRTVDAFSRNNQKDIPAGGLVGELAASAVRKSFEAMVAAKENVRFEFTETEMSDGGIKKTYEIVNRPDANQIKIVDSNDIVKVYHREGESIWYHFNGNENIQVYLKRVSP